MAEPIRTKTTASHPVFLGLARKVRNERGRWELKFNLGRIAVVAIMLGISCWFAVAGALYCFVRYKQNYEEARFSDWLFFRREEHRKRYGDYQVEKAFEAFRKKDHRTFIIMITEGVGRNPANLKGRQMLAYYKIWNGREDLAEKAFNDGICYVDAHAPEYTDEDIDYIKAYMAFLFQRNNPETALKVARHFLPEKMTANPPKLEVIMAYAAAHASHLLGRNTDALAYLDRYKIADSTEGTMLRSEILWSMGHRDEAIKCLNDSLMVQQALQPILKQLTIYSITDGRKELALRYARWLSSLKFMDAWPRVISIQMLRELGRKQEAEAEVNTYVRDFANDAASLTELAKLAAASGDVPLMERIYEIVMNNIADGRYQANEEQDFSLLFVESMIMAHRFEDAQELINQLTSMNKPWIKKAGYTLDALRSIICYSTGNIDQGDFHAKAFVNDRTLSEQASLQLSKRMGELKLERGKRLVIEAARMRFPASPSVLSAMINLSLDEGDSSTLTQDLKTLLETRKAPVDILHKAEGLLASDRFLMARDRETVLPRIAERIRNYKDDTSASSSPASIPTSIVRPD